MIRTAVIVGAGVAGLATAVALEAKGVAVDVFEEAPALRTFGGALMLWSNGVRALRRLDLEREACAVGHPLQGMEFRDFLGAKLWTLPVGEPSAHHGAPSLVVPRSDLVDVLARPVSRRVTFGKTYRAHAELSSHVAVTFSDGTTVRADLLIGADGAQSAVRRNARIRPDARETGYVVWVGRSHLRGSAPVPSLPWGTVGRGLRFWGAPLPNGDVWWYAIIPKAESASTIEEVSCLFEDCHPPVPALFASLDPSSVARAEILDREPTLRFSSARMTLVGDAAHCSRPDVGQGACQALESAVALADQVTAPGSLPSLIREYELARASRTNRVNLLARATAFPSMIRNPLMAACRDIGIRSIFPILAPPALNWLLGEDR